MATVIDFPGCRLEAVPSGPATQEGLMMPGDDDDKPDTSNVTPIRKEAAKPAKRGPGRPKGSKKVETYVAPWAIRPSLTQERWYELEGHKFGTPSEMIRTALSMLAQRPKYAAQTMELEAIAVALEKLGRQLLKMAERVRAAKVNQRDQGGRKL